MGNIFVEDLWKDSPERLKKAVKAIFKISEINGECIVNAELKNDCLVIAVYNEDDEFSYNVYLSDFNVWLSYEDDKISEATTKWLKFMYSVYGDKYVMRYITQRNKNLDKFMAEYEDNYNNETRKVLAEMGVEQYKDKQNRA